MPYPEGWQCGCRRCSSAATRGYTPPCRPRPEYGGQSGSYSPRCPPTSIRACGRSPSPAALSRRNPSCPAGHTSPLSARCCRCLGGDGCEHVRGRCLRRGRNGWCRLPARPRLPDRACIGLGCRRAPARCCAVPMWSIAVAGRRWGGSRASASPAECCTGPLPSRRNRPSARTTR